MTPRQKAIADGAKRYFTGAPCPNGHIAERMVGNSGCVQCHAERAAKPENRARQKIYARVHYRANKDAHLEKCKQWVSKNPDKVRKYSRDFAERNPDKIKNWNRERYERDKDRIREVAYEWRRRNPEKYRAIALNRRSRSAENGGAITAEEIKLVVTRQGGRCALCRAKAKLEMDHIMPIALGGRGDMANMQGLCTPCNRRKSAKHPIEFNRSLGLLL